MPSEASSQLTLTVTEQPAKLHRFRYLKEIKGNRMGSILHSQNSSKASVKVQVKAVESLVADHQLMLIGCTVFEDLTPHPFYLFGDDCSDGVFQKEFSISAGSSECDVCLDRIQIVCTPKKKFMKSKGGEANGVSALGDNYQQRINKWNFFQKFPKLNPFQGKDVNKLKLAFQVFVQVPDSKEWHAANCEPVATDTISDAKIYSLLTVDYIIPKAVFRLDQDVWLYMKDPLPVESANRFKVTLQDKKNQEVRFPELPVKSVKKHLVVFNLSSIDALRTEQSVAVQVVDKETGDASEPVELQLSFPADGFAEPASKKMRSEMTNRAAFDDDVDLLTEIMDFSADPELSQLPGIYVTVG